MDQLEFIFFISDDKSPSYWPKGHRLTGLHCAQGCSGHHNPILVRLLSKYDGETGEDGRKEDGTSCEHAGEGKQRLYTNFWDRSPLNREITHQSAEILFANERPLTIFADKRMSLFFDLLFSPRCERDV